MTGHEIYDKNVKLVQEIATDLDVMQKHHDWARQRINELSQNLRGIKPEPEEPEVERVPTELLGPKHAIYLEPDHPFQVRYEEMPVLRSDVSYNLLWLGPKHPSSKRPIWPDTTLYLRYTQGKLKLTTAGVSRVLHTLNVIDLKKVVVTSNAVTLADGKNSWTYRADLDFPCVGWIDQPNTNQDGALPHLHGDFDATLSYL